MAALKRSGRAARGLPEAPGDWLVRPYLPQTALLPRAAMASSTDQFAGTDGDADAGGGPDDRDAGEPAGDPGAAGRGADTGTPPGAAAHTPSTTATSTATTPRAHHPRVRTPANSLIGPHATATPKGDTGGGSGGRIAGPAARTRPGRAAHGRRRPVNAGQRRSAGGCRARGPGV